ncbi:MULTISPECIES: hypothetical protein [unclassified Legionella]|uniref:hypothetical protein n=1 Tax=unclassified Legionella TaxID=2622702 RepID=UPI0010545E29|nr:MULTISPECIES: hypothetical protein [unclassified Legionella]MDI9819440.1 hypothetical protein [Legionella sp. PL877]
MRKQGHFLLENDLYAWASIAILALIPFATWLSAAIVALITLRKGMSSGFPALAIGIVTLLGLSLVFSSLSGGIVPAVMAFLPCYLAASVLRVSANWRLAVSFIVVQALVGILLVHWLAPEFIAGQYQLIQNILKELERDGSIAGLFNNQETMDPMVIANYMLGLQVVSIALSAIISLMLARSVQARLFYPGGYRQEMLAFRASVWGVVFLIITALGAYQGNPLAISCLPILVVYYLGAGLSLGFNILTKGKGLGALVLLLTPLILLPFVMMPIYAILGALDSLFNFRVYLPANASKK